MFRVTIDGKSYESEAGQTILDALRRLGIQVPALCHDPRLKPAEACRLCLVRVAGHARLLTACDALIEPDMVIETHTDELEESRRTILKMMAHHYPSAAVDRFPEKEFHCLLRQYGLERDCQGVESNEQVDDSNPYIHVDMSRCIYCLRCVRICEEVQGQFVWQLWNRGESSRIRPDSNTNFRDSSCVSCGACVDTCPSGALEDKSVLSQGSPTNWTRTTCAYCGTGCEMEVGTRDKRIVAIKPAMDAPVNRGHLCVKGRYAFEFAYANDRVTRPMVRRDGTWKDVSWDEAILFTAAELQRIIGRYGPASAGVLGSARATNEENYLAQKFARTVLGTNNVDCCARVCHTPSAAALKAMLGTGAATNSFEDIERARTILICGANPTENHPIVGARIKQAVLRGAHLIVIDPRKTELAQYADIHLALSPGSNVPLLNAVACTIVEEGLCDRDFLESRVAGFDEFRDFIKSWHPESVASLCGVAPEMIRQAARLYATEKPAMSFHGLGLTEHSQGTEGVMCLVNLALLTGNLGKAGAGINPLRGQNNVQGSAQMGCEPDTLAGGMPLKDGEQIFEAVWGTALPKTKGLNLMEMIDSSLDGEFKALWAIGYDIYLTNPNATRTRQALQSLELLVVQDMFLNETAREFGTVFLPAASPFEKDGTFMNGERRIQRVRQVIDPMGACKPDWWIIRELARAMGKGDLFALDGPEKIWNEIRSVWNAAKGITYARIENGGLLWPCPSEDHPGTKVLHTEKPSPDHLFSLRRISYQPTKEVTTKDYPFLLTTGRTLYQFNAGTMTSRTRNSELRREDCLDISADDAKRLEIRDDERVCVRSRYGSAVLPARISRTVKEGELFATFHSPHVFLNFVTSPMRDSLVGTPEYKVTAVRVEKL
jgi:formate dehydrogenase major subunit